MDMERLEVLSLDPPYELPLLLLDEIENFFMRNVVGDLPKLLEGMPYVWNLRCSIRHDASLLDLRQERTPAFG